MLAAGGCSSALYEERLGLPHARHNWFQMAPTGPPQGTSGTPSRAGGASGKRCLKHQRTLRKIRKIHVNHKGQRIRNGTGIPLQSMERALP